jgi:predicted nuclease of predicted toxin-antitoxin system
MKFIVDAQLPPRLALWLRERGHEAQSARDTGLREASDAVIWQHACDTGCIIVTKDEDFALVAAALPDNGASVLWVRTGNLVNRLLLARFERAWPEVEAHLAAGAKVVELR